VRGDDEDQVAESDLVAGRTRVGPVSRHPLILVPFIEPRSATIQPVSLRYNSAWKRETVRSVRMK